MTAAADLINHLRAANPAPEDAGVEMVVDLICSAPPAGKKVLLDAVGKAMIRSEVERQAKARKPIREQ